MKVKNYFLRSMTRAQAIMALSVVSAVSGVQAQDVPDFIIPISVTGQNYFAEELVIMMDGTATTGADDFDENAGEPPPPVFGDDTVVFVTGGRQITEEARPTPSPGVSTQFLMRVTFGDPSFEPVTTGVAFNDADGSFGYTAGEDVWVDVGDATNPNGNGVYDDGVDTRLTNVADVDWSTADGTPGELAGLYYADANSDSNYTDGEDIWSDQNTLGFDAILYDNSKTQVPLDGDAFNTAEGTPGASTHTIILRWNIADIQALGEVASIRDPNDGSAIVADMTATNRLVLSASQDIAFVFGGGNVAPTANDLDAQVKQDESLTGATALDPLNDPQTVFDINENDVVTLVRIGADDGDGTTADTVSGGTATIVNNKIEYTPPADFTSDPFDLFKTSWDSFTYTVSDGSLDSTGTIYVAVLPAEIVANRTHASRAKVGNADPDSGLEVKLTVEFTDLAPPELKGSLTKLEIVETLPDGDGLNVDSWTLAAGGHASGFDVGGDNPPDTVVVDGVVITFGWNDPSTLPDLFSFTYRTIGDENDEGSKTIGGELVYNETAGAPEEGNISSTIFGDNTFIATDVLFHIADTHGPFFFDPQTGQTGFLPDPDWRIDADELGRVLTLFNNNKFYQPSADPSSPDGFEPADSAPGATSGFHIADTHGPFFFDPQTGQTGFLPDPDWRIDADELGRVLTLFNNNKFYQPSTDPSSPDGYEPADSAPSR